MSVPLVLTADRLFDGVSDETRRRHWLLIKEGRIVTVEPPAASPPAGVPVLDLGEATLLPGLIDTHSHLVLNGALDAAARWPELAEDALRERMYQAAGRALEGGVTTVRDLGAPTRLAVAVRDGLRVGERPAPHVLVSGAPLTVPGGHGHFMGGMCKGVKGVRAAVQNRYQAGVDVIKVMGSGGRLTPVSDPLVPQFTDAEMSAIVSEAHRLDLPVTVHAYPPSAVEQAAQTGVDGVEHCFFAIDGGLAPDIDVLRTLAESNIAVCPTLGFTPSWRVPASFRAFLDRLSELVTMMSECGVRLLAGTDAGSLPGKPHDVVRFAIIELVQLGLSAGRALRAGTSAAAQVCGLAGVKGVLAPGADADVIAVAGDPLARIADLADLRFVMVGGRSVADTSTASRVVRREGQS